MSTTRLEVTTSGSLLVGTLGADDGPSTFTRALLDDLDAFCLRAEQDHAIRGAVVTGRGRTFCIGSDLQQIERGLADPLDFQAYLTAFNATMHRLERLPVPTVAAINGLTRAGGLELLLACDLAIVADDALIGDGHSAQHAPPGGGSTQRLPRRIGAPRAKELIWSGRFLAAAEAVSWGLCSAAVPPADLQRAAEELLASFTDKPRALLSDTKALIALSDTLPVEDGVEREVQSFLFYVSAHPHVRDGIADFRRARSAKRDASVPGGA